MWPGRWPARWDHMMEYLRRFPRHCPSEPAQSVWPPCPKRRRPRPRRALFAVPHALRSAVASGDDSSSGGSQAARASPLNPSRRRTDGYVPFPPPPPPRPYPLRSDGRARGHEARIWHCRIRCSSAPVKPGQGENGQGLLPASRRFLLACLLSVVCPPGWCPRGAARRRGGQVT